MYRFALVLFLCACGPLPEHDSGPDAALDSAPETGPCLGRAQVTDRYRGNTYTDVDLATCEAFRAQHPDEFPNPCTCVGD